MSYDFGEKNVTLLPKCKKISLFVILFLTLHCNNSKANNLALVSILKPSLGMFGDSIATLWPDEKYLSDHFFTTKIAYPIRDSEEILNSILIETNRYDFCIYNGRINDFLWDYIPEDSKIEKTISNQMKSLEFLSKKCGSYLALNNWEVEFPWPNLASNKLRTRMKQTISNQIRIDTDNFITKNMLLDGGHLNDQGYKTLSLKVIKRFFPFQ